MEEPLEQVVSALAKSLPEQSTRIKGFVENLHKKKPEIAKGLMLASLICK